ncbi:hypothetical protein O181_042988 [Austropuccinia psidii MF-1]|uniref:Uncharacterized protein n=1 Tax=Austropuccinia psidii MF-1 TaxID=1389203 RepID=A0A9Q3HF93_9BASI|nr:hypothetical protein [Austropuccinia psidii MF-1]
MQDSQNLLKAQLSKAQPVSSQANSSIWPAQPPSSSPNLIILKPRKYYILTSAGKQVWSTKKDDDQQEDGDLTIVPATINVQGTSIQILDLPRIIEGSKDGKGCGQQIISGGFFEV